MESLASNDEKAVPDESSIRVTHINSYFLSNPLHAIQVQKLSQKGVLQHIFFPHEFEANISFPPLVGISSTTVPCFGPRQHRLWFRKMSQIWKAFKKDRSNHTSNLNHAHTLITNGIIAWLARRKYGTPYVVTIRNTDVNVFMKRYWFFRWVARFILRDAEHIITLSPCYWSVLIPTLLPNKNIASLAPKHHMIANGCDDFWIKHIGNPKTPPSKSPWQLLFVGSLNRNKNLKTVLEAVNLLSQHGVVWHLTVVGDGPLRPALEDQAKAMPVSFKGFVKDREQLLALYRSSNIFVLPSRTESFGVVYTEALSQGLPVIYTRRQGFDGFFENRKVGIAVDCHDTLDISQAILDITSDYEAFSARAVAASSNFAWKESICDLSNLYRKATKQLDF